MKKDEVIFGPGAENKHYQIVDLFLYAYNLARAACLYPDRSHQHDDILD